MCSAHLIRVCHSHMCRTWIPGVPGGVLPRAPSLSLAQQMFHSSRERLAAHDLRAKELLFVSTLDDRQAFIPKDSAGQRPMERYGRNLRKRKWIAREAWQRTRHTGVQCESLFSPTCSHSLTCYAFPPPDLFARLKT
jgi:hypothetical protein